MKSAKPKPKPDPDQKPPRRTGRPRRADAPKIFWPGIDRALVHGEKHTDPKTGVEGIRYPSFAELAKRYNVSRSLVWRYAHQHNILKRREEVLTKTLARSDEKIVEKLASSHATATVNAVKIVDQFLAKFEHELNEGRVKTDSAVDFDRLTRLRELLTGGADARTEIQGGISLAAIQELHRRQRSQAEGLTPELTGTSGEVDSGLADPVPSTASPASPDVDGELRNVDAVQLGDDGGDQ